MQLAYEVHLVDCTYQHTGYTWPEFTVYSCLMDNQPCIGRPLNFSGEWVFDNRPDALAHAEWLLEMTGGTLDEYPSYD